MQPQVADSQQLQRAEAYLTMQLMVAQPPESHAQAFAVRFGEALTAAGVPDDRHRRSWVARKFGVSVESARKWLTGEALPQPFRIAEIAKTLGVSPSWLQYGEDAAGLMISEPERSYNALELTPAERALVLNYRTASDSGKRIIEATADAAAKAG